MSSIPILGATGRIEGFLSEAHSILRFLSRVWSEEKQVIVKFRNKTGAFNLPSKKIIVIPNYYNQSLKEHLKDDLRWRHWRFLAWHESMHQKFSKDPEQTRKKVLYAVKKRLAKHGFDEELERWVKATEPIVEDCRIEHLGILEYPGYKSEVELDGEIAFEHARKLNAEDPKMSEASKLVVELILFSLCGKRRLRTDSKKVNDLIAEWEPILDNMEMSWFEKKVRLVELVYNSGISIPPGVELIHGLMMRKDKGKTENIPSVPLDPLLANVIKKELQQIVDEMKKEQTKRIAEDGIIQKLDHDIVGVNPFVPLLSVDPHQVESLMAPVSHVELMLRKKLQKWKIGWAEQLKKSGNDLDAEAFLTCRLNGSVHDGRMWFDEERLSPRARFFILWDLSSSTRLMLKTYQWCLMMISRVLAELRCQFELWGFYGEAKQCQMPFIKRWEDRWEILHELRIASLYAAGSTPMELAVEAIGKRMEEKGQDKLVIITDGQPQKRDETKDELRILMSRGVEVYMLGIDEGTGKVSREFLAFLTGGKGLERIRVITEVAQLPDAFFKLISPQHGWR